MLCKRCGETPKQKRRKKSMMRIFLTILYLVSLVRASPVSPHFSFVNLTTTPLPLLNRYIVTVKSNITEEEWNNQHQWITDLVLNHTDISNTTFQGILSSWSFIPNFKGFHVDMPDLLVPIVKKLNWVEDVEPDQNILTFTSNLILDFFPDNWGLERISRRDTASAASIYVYPKNAGLKTNIYILDTGVRTSHSEFKGRARWGRDFTGSGKQTDDNGHGTHVAALAAGSSFGVAKSANIIAVKVLDSSGQGSVSNVISAINWVITDMKSYSGRSIINLSLGGSEKSSALNAVVASAKSAGIPFSVAAGNSNVNACTSSPADSDSVFTVAASTETDEKASFSDFGSCVDIYAPGESLISAWNTNDEATASASGTSMAAPLVSGIMALLLTENPTWTPDQVYAKLKSMATQGKLSKLMTGDSNLLAFTGYDSATVLPSYTSGGLSAFNVMILGHAWAWS